jgi:HEPN domain-containing protein
MTAVDFLVQQIINKHRMAVLINNNNEVKLDIPKDVIEVAKAMEKEQIIEAYGVGADCDNEWAEDYYNEKYKK